MGKQRQLKSNQENIQRNTAILKMSLPIETKMEDLSLFIHMEQPLMLESQVMPFFQVDQLAFLQIDL
jgi:hypothetical protein